MALDPAEKTIKKKLVKRDAYIPDEALAEILFAMERDAAGRWDGAQETDRAGLKGGPGHKATHNGLMNRAFIELAYLTGQRAQEVRSLRWTDINDGYIYFKPTKTQGSSGAAVKIRVSGEIQRVLDSVKSFVAVRNEELVAMAAEEEAKGAKGRRTKRLPVPARSEYVIHRLDGKPFQQTGLRTAWRRAIALTEYKNSGYTIKDIRPKALTDAHEALDDIKQVQKMAAHTNLSTTTGYIRGRGRVAPKVESPLVVPKRSKSR